MRFERRPILKSNRKESPDSGGKPGTVAPGKTGLQESYRPPKLKRTRMICTYNARTLALEAAIEDLMMQAKKIKCDVIGLTETRRRHSLNAVYETGEELFLGTCNSRGVGAVGDMSMANNIDSFEQLTTRIGATKKKYLDLNKSYREDHAFYKAIIGDFGKIGRTPEELYIGIHGLQWNEQGERIYEYIMKTIHGNSQFQKPSSLCWTWEAPGGGEAIKEDLKKRRAEVLAEAVQAVKSIRYVRRDFASRKTRMTALRSPKGTTIALRRGMEKIIHDFYSDLFDSHVHLPPRHLRENGHVIPEVLPSEVRHAIMSIRSRTAPCPDRIRPEHLKNLPPVLINTMARVFTRYMSECKVPKQWKTSKTVLFYKKGDPHDIGNYSPICLRTIDHIHTVSKLIKVSRVYKMQLCLTFIDLKKSFDSAEKEAVMEALDNQGVPTQYIKHTAKAHNLKGQLPEGSMESLATTIRFVTLNCRTLSSELQQAAPSRLLRCLCVSFAALQKTRMRDRPVISIGNYTTYRGDADENKVGGCSTAVRNDYKDLVEEFG
ncbi:hypothetical protein RB195_022355 [Necator americanus]|uniref:Reverse transcriptase domain-containing protein n=1 Tax=Necator americanus TaxID=51031 RepID=A0ABR1EEZ6_NECAM